MLELFLVVLYRHDFLELLEELLQVEFVMLGKLSAHQSLHYKHILAFVLVG